MRRVLIIDRFDEGTAELRAALRQRGFGAQIEDQRWNAVQELRQSAPQWEFVVIVVRIASENEIALLRDLVMASQQFHQSGLPEFVLATHSSCTPSLRMQITRLGARYVRL